MDQSLKKRVELAFEGILWKGRIITLLAVIFSFFSSLALFVAGSLKIFYSIQYTFTHITKETEYQKLLTSIISAVDLYLIAVVLLIFSFGIYELFISKIDEAKEDKEINILEIKNLDDLKNRLLKVIIMALIVHFFKSILETNFHSPTELLYLGLSILAVAGSSVFIRQME